MSYNGRVVRIGVRELNQHTSRVLDQVKRGAVVEVTERGRPVARMVPVAQAAPQSLLERLVAEGRAKPPTLSGLPKSAVFGDPAIDVARQLAKKSAGDPSGRRCCRQARSSRARERKARGAAGDASRLLRARGSRGAQGGTLAKVYRLDVDDTVRATAAAFGDPLLRSLDAIHLATALLVRSELEAFVTYDQRLLAAAAHLGLPTASPC